MNANFQTKATAGIAGGSALLDRVIDSIASVFARLGSIVTNNKIVPVTFGTAATDVVVAHGLGTTVTSVEPVDLDAAAIIYRSPTTNVLPQRQVILRASAPCHAKIRFE